MTRAQPLRESIVAHALPRSSARRGSNALVRIRFPYDLIERLDALAERLRCGSRRRIPRTALVRALVRLRMDAIDEVEIESMLHADPVKRGAQRAAVEAPPARDGALPP